mmetsp:Transcript_58968/g.156339  ORF Transcript_58968/g.156339 Transcript_58968/m.156339 type:complete len:90 (+) Transcript_58968:732-1001(+)
MIEPQVCFRALTCSSKRPTSISSVLISVLDQVKSVNGKPLTGHGRWEGSCRIALGWNLTWVTQAAMPVSRAAGNSWRKLEPAMLLFLVH